MQREKFHHGPLVVRQGGLLMNPRVLGLVPEVKGTDIVISVVSLGCKKGANLLLFPTLKNSGEDFQEDSTLLLSIRRSEKPSGTWRDWDNPEDVLLHLAG
jgi:hypothetical protein